VDDERVLVFDPYYCSGCMYCMTACSTYNNGATSLSKSRIHIARHEGHALAVKGHEDDLIFESVTCQQCDHPYCMYLCPALAMERSDVTGALIINHDKCVGCRMCMVGCPFGALLYDQDRKQIVKCELCGGDPQCVKFCASGALQFVPKRLAHLPRMDRLGRKIVQARTKSNAGRLFEGEGNDNPSRI
jgi:Fe-S-cluster-containing dehydrogenase component